MSNPTIFNDRTYFDLRLTLHILVVTDGAINLWEAPAEPQGSNEGFTLREMARALWDAPSNLYPYTNFVVDHAVHGTGTPSNRIRSEVDPETGTTRKWTQYDPFQFDDPGFKLSNYHQVWFFGYWPGNPNANDQYATPSNRVPLSTAEQKILAAWMNAGGGVFATGDHGLLGNHLCGNISRVGQMRRWSDLGISNDVPSVSGFDRIDTIVPVRTVNGQPEVEFDDQSDDVPKPLYLKRFELWDGLLRVNQSSSRLKQSIDRWAPHPILCSPLGPIDILPDHMHEGLVQEDADVQLDATDALDKKEFPGGANRPRPEVVAWATVRGGNVVYDDLGVPSVMHRIVPTVSVYDGERAKVGRVVVDSTFHNWLDINVRGTGSSGPRTGLLAKNLELVHHYVRNIAQWLATASQRDWMRNGMFLHVIANTGGWSEYHNIPMLIGEQATNVLGQVASVCARNGLIFESWWFDERLVDVRKASMAQLALPAKEFVLHHVLGAMAAAVFDLIPKLRHRKPEDRLPEHDTPREFELIAAHLDAARRAGVRAVTAEWRRSLTLTARFLEAIDESVGGDDGPSRPNKDAI